MEMMSQRVHHLLFIYHPQNQCVFGSQIVQRICKFLLSSCTVPLWFSLNLVTGLRGAERFERLPTTTPGLGSLSSVSIASPDDAASATPKAYMTDVFALDAATVDQDTIEDFYQLGLAPLDLSLSNSVLQETWPDFLDLTQDVRAGEGQESLSYPASFITPALLSANITDDMDIACKDGNDADCHRGSMESSDNGNHCNRNSSQTEQSMK